MCKFLMDSYHFISPSFPRWKSISIRLASSFFLCKCLFFFVRSSFTSIDQLLFICELFGIDLHFFAHKITLWFVFFCFTTPSFRGLKLRHDSGGDCVFVWKWQKRGKGGGSFEKTEQYWVVFGKRRKSLELTINLRTIIDWEAEQIDSCATILDLERKAHAFCA